MPESLHFAVLKQLLMLRSDVIVVESMQLACCTSYMVTYCFVQLSTGDQHRYIEPNIVITNGPLPSITRRALCQTCAHSRPNVEATSKPQMRCRTPTPTALPRSRLRLPPPRTRSRWPRVRIADRSEIARRRTCSQLQPLRPWIPRYVLCFLNSY